MEQSKFDKPFVVVDMGSGNYVSDGEGYEKYNEIRHPKTGKFYGYCPSEGKVNILKLGGRRKDDMVTGVIVIYVRKDGRNNRVITSYISNATIYAKLQDGSKLNRLISRPYGNEYAEYTIESDDLVKINDIPGVESFIIECSRYSPCMFRKQRFYRGTYPELDKKIISYLDAVEEKRGNLGTKNTGIELGGLLCIL